MCRKVDERHLKACDALARKNGGASDGGCGCGCGGGGGGRWWV